MYVVLNYHGLKSLESGIQLSGIYNGPKQLFNLYVSRNLQKKTSKHSIVLNLHEFISSCLSAINNCDNFTPKHKI